MSKSSLDKINSIIEKIESPEEISQILESVKAKASKIYQDEQLKAAKRAEDLMRKYNDLNGE